MVRKGRPPLPANVLRLRGDDKAAERRERETVRPHPVAPKPPADLSPLERQCWQLHAAELEHLGLLTVLDVVSFRLLVTQPFEMAVTAREAMRPRKADGSPDGRKRGFEVVVADRAHGGDLRRHPAFLVWKQAVAEYRSGAREFGLTPSSRVGLRPGAGIGVVPDDEDDQDSDDVFFGGPA